MRVCNAISRFEGRSTFRTWLYRISENQCRTFAVRRARHVQVEHIEALIEYVCKAVQCDFFVSQQV